MAAVVPRWPRLRRLAAQCNRGPSHAWAWTVGRAVPAHAGLDALCRALAAALPSLPDAEQFSLCDSGLGEGAAAELRAAKAAWGSAVTPVLEDDWSRG